MPQPSTTVSVRILEKEYQVNCPEDEIDELTASARYLDAQMRGIRDSGKVLGLDRMAVMAALNIANDLLRIRNERTPWRRRSNGRLANSHNVWTTR